MATVKMGQILTNYVLDRNLLKQHREKYSDTSVQAYQNSCMQILQPISLTWNQSHRFRSQTSEDVQKMNAGLPLDKAVPQPLKVLDSHDVIWR